MDKQIEKKKREEKVLDALAVIFVAVLVLLPLTGVVISTIYQVQIQQEMYGFWSQYRHIWGLYDLWNLTLLGYIPLIIWVYG